MLLVSYFDVESEINPVLHADDIKSVVAHVKFLFNSPGCGYIAGNLKVY